MSHIFISYSQKDRIWVKSLVDALVVEGYDVWWDTNIRAGKTFDTLIEQALKKASCVVGVWSKHSVDSEWVRNESAWAKDRDIFISIRIDDDVALPIKFYQVHTERLTEWDGNQNSPLFQNLLSAIQHLAGKPSSGISNASREDYLESIQKQYGFPDWKNSPAKYQGIPTYSIEKAIKAGISHNDIAEILSWSGMSMTRALVYVKKVIDKNISI